MKLRKILPIAVLMVLLVLLVSSLGAGAAGTNQSYYVTIPKGSVAAAAGLELEPVVAFDYGAYHWLVLNEADYTTLAASGVAHTLAPDGGKVQITGYEFDPLVEGEPAVPAGMSAPAGSTGFYLVQFYGPTNDAWLAGLEAAGLQVLQYYPHYTYLVWGTANQVAAAETDVAVRWTGAVHPAYKMNSDLASRAGVVKNVDIFFYNNGNVQATLDAITALGGNILNAFPAQPDQAFYSAVVELDAAAFDSLAQLDTVLWFGHLSPEPILDDEMSSQIVAGNYVAGVPFVGYFNHLADLGYDGSGVTWAVVDTGVDYDHPDLGPHIVGGYSFPGACNTNPGEDCSNGGHGTHVAGIIGGDATAGFADGSGFLYGLGVAPGYGIFAMNSLSAPAWPPAGGWQEHSKRAVLGGAIGGNNSWTTGEGTAHGYQASERTHDIMVLDGNFDTATVAEPFIEVFSAGNSGPGSMTLTAPKEGKNLIITASSRNFRVGSIDTISSFSSRGPAVDGRWVPTIAAPGEQIASSRNDVGGVCATPITGTNNLYAFCSGTSMAAPHTAGVITLATEWYRDVYGGDPSTDMAKAMVVNSAVDMATADIPNIHEGWGRVNVTNIISPTSNVLYYDQPQIFGNSGEQWTASVNVLDTSQPVRVTLAWSDAPGAVGANPALVNNLNLTVDNSGDTYLGNVFSGGWSNTGGAADNINNLENVYIQNPAGSSLQITVDAVNISGDAILYNGDTTDQSFALICSNCVSQPDFTLDVAPGSLSACVGSQSTYDITIGSILGYSDAVTLSTQGEPAGATTSFDPNPVTPPGTSELTIDEDGSSPAGTYAIDVIGIAASSMHTTTVEYVLYDAVPPAITTIAPADGATDIALAATFTWTAESQAIDYTLTIASDPEFNNVVYSAGTVDTSLTLPIALAADTTYYWQVSGGNSCGQGAASAVSSFTTRAFPQVLLVDDDDNIPDNYLTYSFILNTMGVEYDVWDTDNSDDEPTAVDMMPYEAVIWFTGDSNGPFTGPGSAGEAALADYLAGNKCLMLSSQSYFNQRGLTSFMDNELGVDSVTNDTGQTSVSGTGGVFGGLGPYALSYVFANQSDTIMPDGTAAVGFDGDAGNAAITKDDGYRTTFFGYPYVTIPSTSGRVDTMAAFLNWCSELHVPAVSDDQAGSTWAGQTISYTFTITNDGAVQDEYLFTVESDWETAQSHYESGAVLPGETVEVTIEVMVPAGAAVGEMDTVTLTVRSLSASSIAVATQAVTTVVEAPPPPEEDFLMFLPVVLNQP